MMSPADHPRVVATGRPGFVLREDADLKRLHRHLLTHWELPEVDFRVGQLSARQSHRAQDRFTRLAAACNCLVGELLGGAVLLVGSCMAWASAREWHNLALAVVVAMIAGLSGKALELMWTRARLLQVVRRLRQQLGGDMTGLVVTASEKLAEAAASIREPAREEGVAWHAQRAARPHSRIVAERYRFLLRDARDIRALVLHLCTHWMLPHMRIDADALPGPVARRAQDRLVRWSAGYSYLLAAVLALVCLLAGLAAVVWPTDELRDELVLWTVHPAANWSGVLVVLGVALGAAVLGWLCEVLWVRLRLLWVLFGLRRRLRENLPA